MKTLALTLSLLCAAAPAAHAAPVPSDGDDKLTAARLLIFDRDWPRAVDELRRVVADRKEPLRDQAQYWLAHSLFHMDRTADAIAVLAELEKDYPASRWISQGHSLRVDIAVKTGRPDVLWRYAIAPSVRTPVASPGPPAPTPPPTVPVPARAPRPSRPRLAPQPTPPPTLLTPTDVQIQALGGLMLREPQRAIAELREIVLTQQETPHARRALYVLSLSPEAAARETVVRVATSGPEPLRVAAVNMLARWGTPEAKTVLTTAYATGSERVKLEVLKSLGASGASGYIYEIVVDEPKPELRESGIYRMGAARGRPELARLYNRRGATRSEKLAIVVGSSRVDLQACKLEYSIVSPK